MKINTHCCCWSQCASHYMHLADKALWNRTVRSSEHTTLLLKLRCCWYRSYVCYCLRLSAIQRRKSHIIQFFACYHSYKYCKNPTSNVWKLRQVLQKFTGGIIKQNSLCILWYYSIQRAMLRLCFIQINLEENLL